jgi:hypothetical protein
MRVFISYRREDSEGYVGLISSHARAHYRGRLDPFVDVDRVRIGTRDFTRDVRVAIETSDAVLACIGTRWAGGAGRDARIHQPGDLVRFELEVALATRRPLFIGLVGGAQIPRPSDLPTTLDRLHTASIASLGDERFADDLSALLDRMLSVAASHRRDFCSSPVLQIIAPVGVRHFIAVELQLDGKRFASYAANGEKPSVFSIPEGRHSVQVGSKMLGSNIVNIDARMGEVVTLKFTPRRGWKNAMRIELVTDKAPA